MTTLVLPPQGGDPREVANAVNGALSGALNCIVDVTLAANAASTTVTDPRVGAGKRIFLTPQSAHAAAEIGAGTVWIDPANYTNKTSFVITHANNAQVDRNFSYAILG